MDMSGIFAWLTAVSVWSLFLGYDLKRTAAKSRIRTFLWGVGADMDTMRNKKFDTLIARMGPRVARYFPEGETEVARRQLLWANSPYGLTAESFIALRVLLAGGLPLIFFVVGLGQVPAPFLLILAVVGYLAPGMWLERTAKTRQGIIRAELPLVADLLLMILDAGMDLDAALREVALRQGGEIGGELTKAWQKITTGEPRAATLRAMAAGTGVQEVGEFVQTIILGEQSGQSITKNLAAFASQMRFARQTMAENAASKASLNMLLPTVLFIFVPFLVMLGYIAFQPLLEIGGM